MSDAKVERGNPESFADESYRGYTISYTRPDCIVVVSKEGYSRGISSLRKDARRWVDLLLAGKVRP